MRCETPSQTDRSSKAASVDRERTLRIGLQCAANQCMGLQCCQLRHRRSRYGSPLQKGQGTGQARNSHTSKIAGTACFSQTSRPSASTFASRSGPPRAEPTAKRRSLTQRLHHLCQHQRLLTPTRRVDARALCFGSRCGKLEDLPTKDTSAAKAHLINACSCSSTLSRLRRTICPPIMPSGTILRRGRGENSVVVCADEKRTRCAPATTV